MPRTFSTDSCSPTDIRMPSPANGRTTRPPSMKRWATSVVSAPAGSQTKLPCASETRDERVPALADDLHALEQLGLGVEARERGGLGVGRDGEGDRGAPGSVE